MINGIGKPGDLEITFQQGGINEGKENLSLSANEIKLLINERLKAYIEWTEEAEVGLDKSATKEDKKPFSSVLINKVRNSIAGQFIEEFNTNENITDKDVEDKLFVAKYTLRKQEFPAAYSQENNFVEELILILETLILRKRVRNISLKRFLMSLNHLRLPSSKVGFIDKRMSYLTNLQILSLAGNNISSVPFDWLPSNLQFLELAGNMLNEISYSDNGPPLLYLGLSYNYITDESDLSDVKYMRNLVQLDLSDNDLSDLCNLVENLKLIPKLVGLNLKGNPCSVMRGYAYLVSKGLPNLLYLDGIPLDLIKQNDKENNYTEEINELLYAGRLQISVFRIMGLSKPKIPKGFHGYFEIEVKLPLIDKTLKAKLRIQIEHEIKNGTLTPFANQYELPCKDEINNYLNKLGTSISTKPLWEVNYESYISNDGNIEDFDGLISDKLVWSPIIRPKNPLFEVFVQPENIRDLRDTLRTVITLQIYYCEESRKKKDKFSANMRNLVAKIRVPSEIPSWNEDYRGFVWTAKNQCTAMSYPNISDVKFAVGGKENNTSGTEYRKNCVYLNLEHSAEPSEVSFRAKKSVARIYFQKIPGRETELMKKCSQINCISLIWTIKMIK